MTKSFIPISILSCQPYSKILGFPKPTKKEITSRIQEMKKLGIKSVSFNGPTELEGLKILGKGYVGVVILAKIKNDIFAVKIRRIDAPRKRMQDEARFQKIANEVNVGPKLVQASKNFLVMEYIKGEKIIDWVKKSDIKSGEIRDVINNVLRDCFLLDYAGLDHGELSTIDKHVIVGENTTTIIDFESSSTKRKSSNVSAAVQAIFIGTGLAKIIKKKINVPTKTKIINLIRRYKKNPTRENFENITIGLKLQRAGRFSDQVKLLENDKKLGPIIRRVGPCTMKIIKNPYEMLVKAIIEQQLAGAAARAILGRFVQIYGKFPTPEQVLETRDVKLRKAGLSFTKIKYIKQLSQKITKNEINLKKISKLPDQDIINELIKINGIGKWTAQMYLMFSLKRLDVLPVDDLGIKKGIMKIFSLNELPDAKTIEKLTDHWKPYRSIASWYIWQI